MFSTNQKEFHGNVNADVFHGRVNIQKLKILLIEDVRVVEILMKSRNKDCNRMTHMWAQKHSHDISSKVREGMYPMLWISMPID